LANFGPLTAVKIGQVVVAKGKYLASLNLIYK